VRIVDVHVHLSDFRKEEVEEFVRDGYVLVAVSEDYESSVRNLELRDSYPESVKACVGIHPWKIRELDNLNREVENTLDLVREADCVGEIGLDRSFMPETTFPGQTSLFATFLAKAAETGKPVNVHSAGAWKEVLHYLHMKRAEKVILHWWTGPLNLLKDIIWSGFMISVNASLRIQLKARKIVEEAPLNLLLTESDGPYSYRGLYLSPKLLPEALQLIAQIKGAPLQDIKQKIYENYLKLFHEKT